MSREIPSDGVNYGLNNDNAAYNDHRYVKCWHCGFVCHLDRDPRSPKGSKAGDGITHNPTGWGDSAWGSDPWGGINVDDPIVGSGCPLCGCLHYDSNDNDSEEC